MDHVELVRRQADAYNRGDWDAAVEGVSPDIVWVVAREHPASREIEGLEELREYHEDWARTMPGLRLDLSEITAVGGAVLAVGEIRGSGAGSGAQVGVPIAFVSRFEGESIVRVEEYLDPEEARDAL